jgi:hypothetical protein
MRLTTIYRRTKMDENTQEDRNIDVKDVVAYTMLAYTAVIAVIATAGYIKDWRTQRAHQRLKKQSDKES